MGALAGQCAIVTGGSYGIGFAAARRFAHEGASVVITDIKEHEAAAERLRSEGADCLAVTADVTSDDSVAALIATVMERYGRIDILVNNAAISAELVPAPFEQADAALWHRILDVNVVGVFRMCRAVSPHMRAAGRGRIINVGSGTAFKGAPGMMHYIASKGGVMFMTRALATEFAPDGVLVNAVSPGFTLTESVLGAGPIQVAFASKAIETRLIKRDANADDVARVIYFFASPDSGFVTGQVITADGGSVFH